MATAADSASSNLSHRPSDGFSGSRLRRNVPEIADNGGGDGGDGGNATGTGTMKPAWKKPSDGVIEPSPVMGAVSWPALSESARVSPKSSSDSLKALSDESFSVSQGQVISSAQQKPVVSNANPNSTKNHEFPVPQKSMKQGGHGLANGDPCPIQPPEVVAFQSAVDNLNPPVPVSSEHEVLRKANSWESRSRGEFGRNLSAGKDQQRSNFRRGSSAPSPRGDGHYHNYKYGSSRDQDRGNFESNSHRKFNSRETHLRGFMRSPPPPVPFVTPAMPFGNPMGFPDMPHPLYYVPTPYPDTLRGGAFMPQPGQHMVFFAGPDPHLCSVLVKQIDYYFSPENLCKDIYLRQNMDEQGWVSISLISGFNKVKQLTTNVQLILDAVRTSTVVEVQGDKLRKRGDWMNWPQLGANHFAAVSGSQTPRIPNHGMLANRFQNFGLDEGTTSLNLQGPLDNKKNDEGKSHSEKLVGTSNEEAVS